MFKKIKGLGLTAFCALIALTSFGQSTPKYSNEFLSIGVGARAFGMANTVISSSNDVTGGYWNPASLVHIENNIQVSYMHSNYFAGIANYDYGGLAFKYGDKSVLGFSFVRFGVDGIPNTIDLIRNGQIDYSRVTEFSAVDYGFLFSFAQKTLKEGLSFGGNAKIIHRKAGQFTTAWGFGVDAGLQYKTDNDWHFAVMARDVTSTFNAWKFSFTEAEKDVFEQTGNDIPKNSLEITLPKLLIGAGKKFNFTEDFSLDAAINIDINTDGKRNVLLQTDVLSFDPHMGIEFGYADVVFVRGGIGTIQQIVDVDGNESYTMQPNIGLGVNLNKFVIDYAMANVGSTSVMNYSHVFSIRFNIDSQAD
jgi:hypothetical protein